MCGIAGIWSHSNNTNPTDVVQLMLEALSHRGPDASGIWSDGGKGLVLGHRRLSIIDVSSGGAQPLASPCGRYVLSFNGEIYNYELVRQNLIADGLVWEWRGQSDSEVLLAAIFWWGIERALKNISGMFAFALWDANCNRLILCRDRVGEKPLYYGRVGKDLVFASELSAFFRHPKWLGEIDCGSLSLLMRHNYVPAPYSIFKGVFKLPAASFAVFGSAQFDCRIEEYWSAKQVISDGEAAPFRGSPEAAVDKLEDILSSVIHDQMVSDVPLGAFLSGGVDSSTVVALMQAHSNTPVRTFSIGFSERGYDEAQHAQAVSNHLKTEHTEHYVSENEAMEVVPLLPTIYSEPFSDSSQIPTFLVSKLAKTSVTVSLSGDGGDELFSGYTRYNLSESLVRRLNGVPLPVRKAAASMLRRFSGKHSDLMFRSLMIGLPQRFRVAHPAQKAKKLAELLQLSSPEEVYLKLISHWDNPTQLVNEASEYETALTKQENIGVSKDYVRQMMFLDMVSYLPDDILTKVDRAAMSVGLETRVPMVDRRVIEFAASLPMNILRNDGQGKWPLRQLLYRHVPKALVDRPKMGFGVPLGAWLRGGLRDWAEPLLSKEKLTHGLFDCDLIDSHWHAHISGEHDYSYQLWDILMFQAWYDNYKK